MWACLSTPGFSEDRSLLSCCINYFPCCFVKFPNKKKQIQGLFWLGFESQVIPVGKLWQQNRHELCQQAGVGGLWTQGCRSQGAERGKPELCIPFYSVWDPRVGLLPSVKPLWIWICSHGRTDGHTDVLVLPYCCLHHNGLLLDAPKPCSPRQDSSLPSLPSLPLPGL